MVKKTTTDSSATTEEKKTAAKKKSTTRTTRKKKVDDAPAAVEEKKAEEAHTEAPATPATVEVQKKTEETQQVPKPAPAQQQRKFPYGIKVNDFTDLQNMGGRIPMLSDQQIQQLTYEDAISRSETLEDILRQVLDYDIVISDTNIWLELLLGHTSSHSDPRVNARLQFERQLEAISKMMKRIGGKFMIMSETYEEVDRFASVLDPVSYKDADWNDEVLCRNVAARLAKRLMLAQQKENRLRIEGIGSESHHGAFADPAIIRRTVELFAQGKKVLLLTNDASVGIRALGMCDDLQRVNNVSDEEWTNIYEPQRPMVLTMDDLKLLDQYSRQYHFLQMASNRQWMQDVERRTPANVEKPLELWLDGFRPGDRHERRSDRIEQQRKEQQRKEQQRAEQERKEKERKERREAELKAAQERREAEQRAAQERREAQSRADKERARQKAEQEKAAQAEQEKPAEETAPQTATKPETKKSRKSSSPAPQSEVQQPSADPAPTAQPEQSDASQSETAPVEKKSRPRRSRRKPAPKA